LSVSEVVLRPLSPPYRNSTFSDSEKLDILYGKIGNCCVDSRRYYFGDGSFKDFPVCCDNRSCDHPVCKKHRLYKFLKAHSPQIEALNRSMRKPKAWVFTGFKMPLVELTRGFCRFHHSRLLALLKRFSVSEFSGHMEIKVYGDGDAYLHWHVVSAGFRNLRLLRKLWDRQILYEEAIVPVQLGYYVSKYASKTPCFSSDCDRELYHLLVYKTQMHFFSVKPPVVVDDVEFVIRSCYSEDSIYREIFSEYYRDSHLKFDSPSVRKRRHVVYHPILEPPPVERGLDCFGLVVGDSVVDVVVDDSIDCSPDPDFPFEPVCCKPDVDYVGDSVALDNGVGNSVEIKEYCFNLGWDESLRDDYLLSLDRHSDNERLKALRSYRCERKRRRDSLSRLLDSCKEDY